MARLDIDATAKKVALIVPRPLKALVLASSSLDVLLGGIRSFHASILAILLPKRVTVPPFLPPEDRAAYVGAVLTGAEKDSKTASVTETSPALAEKYSKRAKAAAAELPSVMEAKKAVQEELDQMRERQDMALAKHESPNKLERVIDTWRWRMGLAGVIETGVTLTAVAVYHQLTAYGSLAAVPFLVWVYIAAYTAGAVFGAWALGAGNAAILLKVKTDRFVPLAVGLLVVSTVIFTGALGALRLVASRVSATDTLTATTSDIGDLALFIISVVTTFVFILVTAAGRYESATTRGKLREIDGVRSSYAAPIGALESRLAELEGRCKQQEREVEDWSRLQASFETAVPEMRRARGEICARHAADEAQAVAAWEALSKLGVVAREAVIDELYVLVPDTDPHDPDYVAPHNQPVPTNTVPTAAAKR